MNGAHDLGGKHGFGEIDRTQITNFASEWEAKVFALTLACGMLGRWNLDQSRSAREQMNPAHYLNSSYYEHWLSGLEDLLVENHLLTRDELNSGVAQQDPSIEPICPTKMQQILSVGSPTQLPTECDPQFAIGDLVVVTAEHPLSHTRAPGYVKGKPGIIIADHGAHIFADEHASSGEKTGEYLYGVKFDASTLWGERAENCDESVYVDLFEPYLMSIESYIGQFGSVR